MEIHHIAIWVKDLERIRNFYVKYFNADSSDYYYNPKKQFKSCFLSFSGGPEIELMNQPGKVKVAMDKGLEAFGLTHFAISAGSKKAVDNLTEKLRTDGYKITREPRTTGDGFYESVILDPEGNRVEITE
ncbi:VOC family protein [Bacteroidota bacterium]